MKFLLDFSEQMIYIITFVLRPNLGSDLILLSYSPPL